MGERAARRDDPTQHGGQVTSGFDRVLIGGKPAARIGEGHCCPVHGGGPVATGSRRVLLGGVSAARRADLTYCIPAALSDAAIAAEAAAFLPGVADPKAALANYYTRLDFLKTMAVADLKNGASAVEAFSNTVQRSRWINSSEGWLGKSIDANAVGKDVGMVFSGYNSPWDVLWGQADHTYNVNQDPSVANWPTGEGKPAGLPFTGFKEQYRNDDLRSDGLRQHQTPYDDQTHHLAFFVMAATWDQPYQPSSMNQPGSFLLSVGGSIYADPRSVQDLTLGFAGARIGLVLGDVSIDINAFIWWLVGDPTQAAGKGGAVDPIADGCPSVEIGD